jgi:hypothetical protein
MVDELMHKSNQIKTFEMVERKINVIRLDWFILVNYAYSLVKNVSYIVKQIAHKCYNHVLWVFFFHM